jgi:hypothetical protein
VRGSRCIGLHRSAGCVDDHNLATKNTCSLYSSNQPGGYFLLQTVWKKHQLPVLPIMRGCGMRGRCSSAEMYAAERDYGRPDWTSQSQILDIMLHCISDEWIVDLASSVMYDTRSFHKSIDEGTDHDCRSHRSGLVTFNAVGEKSHG